VILFLVGLFTILGSVSCSTIVKLITGYKNPELYLISEERITLYQPWMEVSMNTRVYVIESTDDYLHIFNNLENLYFPSVLIKNYETGVSYILDCNEDIKSDCEDILRGSRSVDYNTSEVQEELLDSLYIHHINNLDYSNSLSSNDGSPFTVTILYGSFLGNKVKRRITKGLEILQPIDSLTILDMSMNRG
jgi:hypothetical protein